MNAQELATWKAENPGEDFPAYVWPGGYPLVYITRDGDVMCADCASGKGGSLARIDSGEQPDDGWNIAGAQVHYEGPAENCCHCGTCIDSAYGDPESEEQS